MTRIILRIWFPYLINVPVGLQCLFASFLEGVETGLGKVTLKRNRRKARERERKKEKKKERKRVERERKGERKEKIDKEREVRKRES